MIRIRVLAVAERDFIFTTLTAPGKCCASVPTQSSVPPFLKEFRRSETKSGDSTGMGHTLPRRLFASPLESLGHRSPIAEARSSITGVPCDPLVLPRAEPAHSTYRVFDGLFLFMGKPEVSQLVLTRGSVRIDSVRDDITCDPRWKLIQNLPSEFDPRWARHQRSARVPKLDHDTTAPVDDHASQNTGGQGVGQFLLPGYISITPSTSATSTRTPQLSPSSPVQDAFLQWSD